MDLVATISGEHADCAEIWRLHAHLLAHGTATDALESWCAARGIGHGPIRTELLGHGGVLNRECRISWRRVRILRGNAFLSLAEIRFRTDALTVGMIERLADGQVPFGAVVEGLRPLRTTTFFRVGPRQGHGNDDAILEHHATVLEQSGRPLARVRESYQRALIEPGIRVHTIGQHIG